MLRGIETFLAVRPFDASVTFKARPGSAGAGEASSHLHNSAKISQETPMRLSYRAAGFSKGCRVRVLRAGGPIHGRGRVIGKWLYAFFQDAPLLSKKV